MEGKEVRYGITISGLQEETTTATSTGTVMSFHDSYTPLGGLVLITNIALGEMIFGGVGAGLYTMLMFAIIAVFIAGLMVGRTPEYLGKKIERKEIMMAVLALLVSPLVILGFTGVAMALPQGLVVDPATLGRMASRRCCTPITSANGNNGSAFAGLAAKPLLQLDDGLCDADRALCRTHRHPGLWRLAGRQTGGACRAGYLPDDGSALRGSADWRDPDCGRADLLPGVFAGAGCRTIADASREGVLRCKRIIYNLRRYHLRHVRIHLKSNSGRRAARGTSRSWIPRSSARAIPESFKKLDPRVQLRNPVMFVVEVGSVITTIEFVRFALYHTERGSSRAAQLTSETTLRAGGGHLAVVHRGLRQLRRGHGRGTRQSAGRHAAPRAHHHHGQAPGQPDRYGAVQEVAAPELRKGDLVLVEAGDVIPGDGDVVEGVASVDESAITGESAPVIRESGGDRSAVTGGTRVLSDWIVVQISANPGETFLDRMIALVEGAKRQKTPNEIALNILIASLTIIFVLVVVSLEPFAIYSGPTGLGHDPDRAAGVSDPDHHRRPALGHRHRGHGPHGAAQRAGHERARGGSSG